jgi:hypothetical protein
VADKMKKPGAMAGLPVHSIRPENPLCDQRKLARACRKSISDMRSDDI